MTYYRTKDFQQVKPDVELPLFSYAPTAQEGENGVHVNHVTDRKKGEIWVPTHSHMVTSVRRAS